MADGFEMYTKHLAKCLVHSAGSAESPSLGGSPTDIHLLMETIISIETKPKKES